METTEIFLEIFNKKYEVLGFNLGFVQGGNAKTGKVGTVPIAENLTLEILSDGENDFVDWMVKTTKSQNGELSFMSGNKLEKSIKFDTGYLIGYRQNFGIRHDPQQGNQRVITEDLTINFKLLDFGDVKFDKSKKAA